MKNGRDETGRRVLVVVATGGEAARLRDLPFGGELRVAVSGVGPVAAALATASALGAGGADLVISAGIGGAYPGSGLLPGESALSTRIVWGDLGAWDGPAFLPLSQLGLESAPGHAESFPCGGPGGRAIPALADALGLRAGPFVTVSAVTGSLEMAGRLERQVPGALIEGMEGAGVAHAALLAGVPCLELRAVSNAVGPRDRAAWQIGPALAGLGAALAGLLALLDGPDR